ncbi:NAD(P)-dependent oxidoreductase [Indiicoccus explosivorum]|uniref:NAD(P)-dependent oxidoreductase n=1 Tax=Indiicoccus explosivorum TaxID=1917864 RepID=UPI000B43B064|nr:SDR family oxidoreductase [Indiicoccus explosivorum]
MRIALFGSTGRTGSEIMKRALKDGHHVTVLARRQVSGHPNLKVVIGDARNRDDVKAAITGADAVISALGTDRSTTLTEAMPLIIGAMEAEGIRRIVTIGTAGILNSRLTPGALRFQGGDSKRRSTFAAEEHESVYRMLEASDLDWTVVCPTFLPDGEARGGYRTEKDFLPEGGSEITTDDTAAFAYRELFDARYNKSRAGIAY